MVYLSTAKKTPLALLKQRRGASIAEVLIFTALISILSLAMVGMLNEQIKSVSYLEDKLSAIALEKEVTLLLSNKESCEKSFSGEVLTAAARNVTLKLSDGTTEFAANNKFDKLIINTITLKDRTVGGASRSGIADVELTFSRLRSGGGPSQNLRVKVPIAATTDVGTRISTCSQQLAPSSPIADICSCSGGPATGCSCCDSSKSWTLISSWDQDDRHGVHRPCLTCPTQNNINDWMVSLCVSTGT